MCLVNFMKRFGIKVYNILLGANVITVVGNLFQTKDKIDNSALKFLNKEAYHEGIIFQ